MAGEDRHRQEGAAAEGAGLSSAGVPDLLALLDDPGEAVLEALELLAERLVLTLELAELVHERLAIVAVDHAVKLARIAEGGHSSARAAAVSAAARWQSCYRPRVSRFQTRHCTAPACGLRFPVAADSSLGDRCPHCGAATAGVDAVYDTAGARDLVNAPPGPALEVLLDNVRSLRNVGAIFRSADGVGVRHVHVGGFTPTPSHPGMAKTALGAEQTVPWTLHRDGAAAAANLRDAGLRLWALEGGPRSRSLFDAPTPGREEAVVLVLGHEVSGVDPRIVDLCEAVVHLPMIGSKGSLNVAVAFGVAAYAIRYGLRAPRG